MVSPERAASRAPGWKKFRTMMGMALSWQRLKAVEKNDGIAIYQPGQQVTLSMHPRDIMSYPAQA